MSSAGFAPIEAPANLRNWLRDEAEYCLSVVPYGSALKYAWETSRPLINEQLRNTIISPDVARIGSPVFRSLENELGFVPGYQGIIERCLRLVQRADEQQHGNYITKIAAATLATNDRYAAVYKPHVCPDWHVIALDWGFICGIWGMASVLAGVLPLSGDSTGVTMNFDAGRLSAGLKSTAERVTSSLASFLVPCILMGEDPPVAIPPIKENQNRITATGLLFNAMIFIVVAHEYGHVQRGHLGQGIPNERRRQMEFEADGIALAYALTNPWKSFATDSSTLGILAASLQPLVLSFIRMLEMGDNIMNDLGSKRQAPGTHPPAEQRLAAIQFLLNEVLGIDGRTKHLLNRAQEGLVRFGDEMWNTSVTSIVTALLRHRPVGSPVRVQPRNADLKFL